jgi:hypothetical protein
MDLLELHQIHYERFLRAEDKEFRPAFLACPFAIKDKFDHPLGKPTFVRPLTAHRLP